MGIGVRRDIGTIGWSSCIIKNKANQHYDIYISVISSNIIDPINQ